MGRLTFAVSEISSSQFSGISGTQTPLGLDHACIDPHGQLIYEGAIDDKPTTEKSDIAGATNYVVAALQEAMAGKPVAVATSRPYGVLGQVCEITQFRNYTTASSPVPTVEE